MAVIEPSRTSRIHGRLLTAGVVGANDWGRQAGARGRWFLPRSAFGWRDERGRTHGIEVVFAKRSQHLFCYHYGEEWRSIIRACNAPGRSRNDRLV